MKVFEYDICDGDKGVIFAESYERAVEIFSEAYPEADPECYDYTEIDQDKYEFGATIGEVGEYTGEEKLMFCQ